MSSEDVSKPVSDEKLKADLEVGDDSTPAGDENLKDELEPEDKEDIELKVIDETTPLKTDEDEVKVDQPETDDKTRDGEKDPEQPDDVGEPEVKQPRRKFDFFENKWILLGILLVLLLAIIIVIIAIVATRQPPSKLKVEPGNLTDATDKAVASSFCGTVYGSNEDGAFAFRGIPYAKPPVNELRWSPPVSVSNFKRCFPTPFNASKAAPSCYQKNGKQPMSEDCLYVDVFTPSVSFDAQLPVMVYISADDNTFLRGVDGVFEPSAKLASDTGMVFVRFNYRVGPFGYLQAHCLGSESGNYGLMDQVEALKWVHFNIVGFGGNKGMVTIFGVGSGAASVLALMSAPSAKGYFHRAWLASGVENIDSKGDPALYESLFVKGTSCGNVTDKAKRASCLRGLSAEAVANADYLLDQNDAVLYELPSTSASERAVRQTVNSEGDILPQSSIDAIKSGSFSKVPVLIGSMGQEVNFYYMKKSPEMSWNFDDMYSNVTEKLKVLLPTMDELQVRGQIENLYNREVSPTYQLATLVSDILVSCPLNRLATVLASMGYPTYRYEVVPKLYVNSESYLYNARWAFHGYDMAAYFGQFKEAFQMASKFDNYDLSTEEERNFDVNFQAFLRLALNHFAKKGEVPGWGTFKNGTVQTYDLDTGTSSGTQLGADKCQLWDSLMRGGSGKVRGWEF